MAQMTLKELNGMTHRGEYIQTVFDPVQTHAWYGLSSKEDLERAKRQLKGIGNRFRQVKTHGGFYILCFKLK